MHFSCTAIILSKSALSKSSIKQSFTVGTGFQIAEMEASLVHSQAYFPVKGWYIQPLVVTRRIRTIQNWANNSTKDILIKKINCFFIERNLNKESEFSLEECAEHNSLRSSQSHLKNCFWSSLSESRPQLLIQNSHWFSLLLCVTALVNVKDQNSWHRAFSVLPWQKLLKIQVFLGSDHGKKNTADRSKNLLKFFSQKLLMRQKSNKYMAINIFKDFCKY